MIQTNSVEFGYGRVSFNHAVEPVPASTQRNGNVTINNAAIPGRPAYFEISTMIRVQHEEEGIVFSNVLHLDVALTGLPKDTPYAEVDAQAARKLAPLLREIADSIEQQVAEYDAKLAG